jgi:solute:Na+ symporter, SSS family
VNWLLVALLGYLAAQLAIGVWVAPRIRTEGDYLIAGRQLGYPLTVFSIFATWFGAETCIASAGRAYREGVSLTTAEPFAYGLCLVIMGLVFAAPLWHRKLTTLADLFRTRYSVGVERTAAIIMIPSSLLWAAAQMRGFGHVLTTVTTLDVQVAIAVAAGFCVLYTVFGGLLADAITDLLQGIVLTVGLLVLVIAVVVHQGGPAAAIAAIPAGQVTLIGAGADASLLGILEEWAVPVCGSVIATELVSRVIATRSPSVARNAPLIAGAMYIAIGLLPVFVGLTAGGLIPPLRDTEQFLPAVARTLLGPVPYVIFAGGLISAILSTVDTTLLVASGLLSHNLIGPVLGITDERRRLRIARLGVAAFGVVAYVLAVRASGVFALVEQASAFGSAGILVVVCFGLFTTWGGARTALVTVLGGLAVYLLGAYTGMPYPFLASLAASLALYLLGVLASWRLGLASRRLGV